MTDEATTMTPYIVVCVRERGPLTDGAINLQHLGEDLDVVCKAILNEGDYDYIWLIDPDNHVIVWKQERGRRAKVSQAPN